MAFLGDRGGPTAGAQCGAGGEGGRSPVSAGSPCSPDTLLQRLIAPFDGQVLSVGLGEGRAVEAYRAVMVVADPSELEVSADLTATQLQDLVEGMAATVTIANRPGSEFEGYIRRLPYPYGGGGGRGGSSDSSPPCGMPPMRGLSCVAPAPTAIRPASSGPS